jgi:hypothetical protein
MDDTMPEWVLNGFGDETIIQQSVKTSSIAALAFGMCIEFSARCALPFWQAKLS